MRARLHLPVTMTCESSLGYRPDLDADPPVMDKNFERAGRDFLTLIIERTDEADNCLSETAR